MAVSSLGSPRYRCGGGAVASMSQELRLACTACVSHGHACCLLHTRTHSNQGVLREQDGRCVITYSDQDASKAVTGVSDFLQHSGETRIKKWRRHVHMLGEFEWIGSATKLL